MSRATFTMWAICKCGRVQSYAEGLTKRELHYQQFVADSNFRCKCGAWQRELCPLWFEVIADD